MNDVLTKHEYSIQTLFGRVTHKGVRRNTEKTQSS